MKGLLIVLITFVVAGLASALLDWPWIAKSVLRCALVWLLVAAVLVVGFRILLLAYPKQKQPEE